MPNLPVFGKGAKMPKTYWMALGRALVAEGHIGAKTNQNDRGGGGTSMILIVSMR